MPCRVHGWQWELATGMPLHVTLACEAAARAARCVQVFRFTIGVTAAAAMGNHRGEVKPPRSQAGLCSYLDHPDQPPRPPRLPRPRPRPPWPRAGPRPGQPDRGHWTRLARFHKNHAVPIAAWNRNWIPPHRNRFRFLLNQIIAMDLSNQGKLAFANERWNCAIGRTVKVTAAYDVFLTVVAQIAHVTQNLSAGAMRRLWTSRDFDRGRV